MKLKFYGGTDALNAIAFNVTADRTYSVTLKKEMSYQGFTVRANAYTFEICYIDLGGNKIIVGPGHDVALANLNDFLDSHGKTVIKDQTIAQEDAEIAKSLDCTEVLEVAEDIARQHAIDAALDARDKELFMALVGAK